MNEVKHTVETIAIEVSDSIGKVSAIVVSPGKPVAVLVLAHGAGAGMSHPFMTSIAMELAKLSIATVRYNFPYMEKRKNRPDPPAIAGKTVEKIIEKAHSIFDPIPLFAGGKSFGGRMTSQRMSKEPTPEARGIVFFGFPLHPLGSPSIERAEHLYQVKVPMLFLQGTRDAMAEMSLLRKVCSGLSAATLSTIEGADHSFKAGKKDLLPELARRTKDWMKLN